MEFSVTRKTTHIVTTGVRTINLLRGIIRGCWLVKFDWIKESVEAGEWLPAEKYEIDHFSKAVKVCFVISFIFSRRKKNRSIIKTNY